MGQILRPNEKAGSGQKIVFTSGPVRGARPWQEQVGQLLSHRTNALIAINSFHDSVKLHRSFDTRYEWGWYHREQALQAGVVMFWFPKQNYRIEANSSHLNDHPYGRNAFFELGLCLKHKMFKPRTKIAIGIGGDFDCRRAVIDRIKLSELKIEPVVGSLEALCEYTLGLIGS